MYNSNEFKTEIKLKLKIYMKFDFWPYFVSPCKKLTIQL